MQELSAQQYVQDHRPRSWSRSTVADGRWMQDKTFTPLNGNDEQLGIFIDDLVKGLNTEETKRAEDDAAEAAARLAYDGILSGRCDFLYTSAQQLRTELDQEVTDRKKNCNDASANAYNLSKEYTDEASGYLDKRIDGVSGAFSSFRDTINGWKTTVDDTLGQYGTDIGNLQNKTNQLSIDIKTSADKVREEFALADGVLQDQIDALTNATDVIDVVGTTADMNPYQGFITSGDVIKVLSGTGGKQEYYKWTAAKSATSAPFSEFSLVGSLEPYYTIAQIDDKFTNYYNTTQIDDKLAYKVGVTSQSFTTAQQLQARINIGASDGTIEWVGAAGTINAPLKVVSAAGGIHIEDVQNDAQATYKYYVAPEPTTNNLYDFFGVFPNERGGVEVRWGSPFPALSRPDDLGKALVVDTNGFTWKDLGPGYYFVDLKNTTSNTLSEVKAAASAHKTIIGYEEAWNSDYTKKAIKYFTFAGEYWDQYAFFDSNQNELQEKRRLWANGDVSEYNNRFLYTSAQILQEDEKTQVRTNIEAAQAPLIIQLVSTSYRVLTTEEFDDLEDAVDAYREVIVQWGSGAGSTFLRLVHEDAQEYTFASWTDSSLVYATVQKAGEDKRKLEAKTRVQIVNQMPQVFEEDKIYLV